MKFYNKCSENSRSQIVFRTDIFPKIAVGCPWILFLSATVAFRTNILSLADFKSDLSRTNLKLPSSATWPKAACGGVSRT